MDGYISLQEQSANWGTVEPLTIVNVHAADVLAITPDFKCGEQGYDETVLVQHVYLNKFTIWEGIIRDALAERRIEIS